MFTLLLFAACSDPADIDVTDPGHDIDNPNTTDTDDETPAETFTAELASERAFARIDGDTVTTWVESTSSVSVTISGTEPTYVVETIYTEEVASDSKATIDHYDGSTHFVSDTVNVDEIDEDNKLRDCVDLQGSWVLKYDGYSAEYPFSIDTATCTPETDMDDDVMVDGYYFTSDDFEGVISDNGNTINIVVHGNDGSFVGTATATRE